MISESLSIYVVNHPFGVSSTLHFPVRPKYFTNSVVGKRSPLGRVHVDMVAVSDVLVVDNGGGHAAEAVTALHVVEEGGLKLLRVALDNAVRVLAEDLHLALVALAHAVALEPVLVPALLLAHLAVPPQLLQAFGFDSVRYRLRSQKFVLPH
ncbi:DNA/RNA-binding protein Kin17, conserved region [Actinidia rufa]|uniref:DNA/RNA-binding protein Kin17, conserved region n=1 Tax=Actinidia rufa TaxID=165716 RepID=A0A7J0GVV9_9ERIC|nr:DNA/RNA-binding protein Kin17, conserved region [Actinidia rufa]